ncbi:7-carboxy-7-deazaguanine synthase QueE [Halalkalibacter alkalisediminis]|uniref:7-carboxy-7-deazaguanine synthase n=1 Tax=Halalkalibacter alkalisediminis TaxID=935616 RepID=A0ABV6NMH4_9BACI|nr:7-carboxy-7-deazaguanine synthase QueE [Halalkalibacter alkalisediminis]
MKVPVMEIFGPTIQGEGMVIGQKTMFVRTGGCDYSCSWCDSRFTWDGSTRSNLMQVADIVSELERIGGERFSHVTISGGNPALHKGIDELIEICHQKGWKVAIETQGSIWQEWMKKIDDVTVSPKPPSSKMETNYDKLDHYMEQLEDRNVSLKVVVFNDADFDYAELIHKRYPFVPFYLQIGNEEVSSTDDASLVSSLLKRYEWLIEKATQSVIMNDAKVLPQLHTLIWGNKRGV